MSTAKQSPVVQKALVTNNTQLRTKPKSVRSRTKEKSKNYLKVQIVDMSEADWPRVVEVLEAGKTYTVVITCREQPFEENRQWLILPIMDAFTLFLYYESDTSTNSPISPARAKFYYEQPFAEENSCIFTVSDDFPSSTLKIKLQVQKQGSNYPDSVGEYTVPVQGLVPSPEQEIFSVRRINEHLPEETALLLVQDGKISDQKLLLRGWTTQGLELDISKPIHIDIISLEEILSSFRGRNRTVTFRSLLNRFSNFSRTSPPEFLLWVKDLYKTHQHNLVIVDLTTFEIPWEMLEFQPRQYIGAYIKVARWLKTQYFTETRKFSIEPHQHIGSVVSYLDTPGLGNNDVEDEVTVLEQADNESYLTINSLEKRMYKPLDKIGMIYVGSHGNSGQRLQQRNPELVSLNSENAQGDYSSRYNPELLSINLENLYKSDPPRLTVFINACESARIIKSTPTDNSNFVEEFLAHCAENYIGTLAKVDSKIASSIAKRIIATALEPDGVNVAEVLRMLRAEAADSIFDAHLRPDSSEKPFYDFIHTFMYVYYGNPLARLQLRRRKDTEE